MTSNMQARRKSRPIPVSVKDLPRFSSVAVEIRSPLGQRILQDQNYLGFSMIPD
jgi:hypothetical protein